MIQILSLWIYTLNLFENILQRLHTIWLTCEYDWIAFWNWIFGFRFFLSILYSLRCKSCRICRSYKHNFLMSGYYFVGCVTGLVLRVTNKVVTDCCWNLTPCCFSMASMYMIQNVKEKCSFVICTMQQK